MRSTVLAALKAALATKADRPAYRVGLRYAGADPRETLRAALPGADEITDILAGLDRLDASSAIGPWTRATLRLIDAHPEVRAPELAAQVGRPTAEFKRDVRKLKDRGLTESLAIGYRLSPRGEAVARPRGRSATSVPHVARARRCHGRSVRRRPRAARGGGPHPGGGESVDPRRPRRAARGRADRARPDRGGVAELGLGYAPD